MGAVCLQSQCMEPPQVSARDTCCVLDEHSPNDVEPMPATQPPPVLQLALGDDKLTPRRSRREGTRSKEVQDATPRSKAPLAPEFFRSVRQTRVRPVAVTLNVYDVGINSNLGMLNKLLRPMGSGAFHCGVEIMGWEWFFTDIVDPEKRRGTGVFQCLPQSCPGHAYSESVAMGQAFTSEDELYQLIKLLEYEWPCREYDTLTHNCCHFANEFCQRLGLGGIPAWIMHLAGVGAATENVTDTTCCRMVAWQVSSNICCDDARVGFPVDRFYHEVNSLPALTSSHERNCERMVGI